MKSSIKVKTSGGLTPYWATPRPIIFDKQHISSEEDQTDRQDNFRIYGNIPVLETTSGDLIYGPRLRLLKILPGAPNDDIRGRLMVRPLFDTPPYIALSYCWGRPLALNTIFIADAPFAVTRHLWQALQALRDRDEAVLVWIDAICINQANSVDKSIQVHYMAQIYNQASEVRIWLGKLHTSLQASDMVLFYELSLLSQPWWKRLWVVQECAYAKTEPVVMLRPTELTTLGDLVRRLSVAIDEAEPIAARTLNTMLIRLRIPYGVWDAQRLTQAHRIPLSVRLRQTRKLECSDSHDRLYAILSLVNEEQASTIVPDYDKPYYELVWEVRRCIENFEFAEADTWRDDDGQDLLPSSSLRFEPDIVYEDNFVSAAQAGSIPLAKQWLRKCSNPASIDSTGAYNEALYEAAGNGHLHMVRHLVDVHWGYETPLDDLMDLQRNPLSYAARMGHLHVVDFLLRSKVGKMLLGFYPAEIDGISAVDASTALMDAAAFGKVEVVAALLAYLNVGMLNVRSGYFGTALQAAMLHGDESVVKLLVEQGADNNGVIM